MGLKESLKAWERNADIACLIARMNPEGGTEHFLEGGEKEIKLTDRPLQVLYLLENGTYQIKKGQESATIVGSNAPKILIVDTRENAIYTAGTQASIDLVKKYLKANPIRAMEPGVFELAAKISKQGPDPEAKDPSCRDVYIPIAIIEIHGVGRY